MKKLAVLGSTGSIGTQTLEVVRNNPEFQITALAAGSNIALLEEQIREFHPSVVGVYHPLAAQRLTERLSGQKVSVYSGMEGLIACAVEAGADMVVSAVVGMIGIRPVMEAIRAGKDIALANKETLVTAGHLILPLVEKYGVQLLPVDSEHSAIFQSLEGIREHQKIKETVSRIFLTASGGPFRGRKKEELKNVTVEEALKHPNWSMGKKITIDSATMVNKGLEVMEACWLFGLPAKQIQVIIQPQSIIHSAVEFIDGGIIAQLGTPDMKLPIQYALTYPKRKSLPGKRIDFFELGKITFEQPDFETFRGLALAYEAMKQGGSMPTVYNAANERAVEKFLNREISFLAIPELIERAMAQHKQMEAPSISEILETEEATYQFIETEAKKREFRN